ncbi:MAG: hypothetical protein R2750_08445 [Bacteroidales bacterium]
MKKLLFILMAFGVIAAGFSQQRVYLKEELRNKAVRKGKVIQSSSNLKKHPACLLLKLSPVC